MIKRFKYTFAPTWLPEPAHLRVQRNPNYLQSLVVGIVSPIFHLPFILFYTFVTPLWDAIKKVVLFFLVSFFAGITGKACGVRLVDVKMEEATEEEIQAYMKAIFEGELPPTDKCEEDPNTRV